MPAIRIAMALKSNRKFLHLHIYYFLLRYLINMGAHRAPKAAPTGSPPISPPITLCLPALGPKYKANVVLLTLDRYARQKPK